MKFTRSAALLIGALVLEGSVVQGSDSIRADLRRLVEQDAKVGGKSAPKQTRLPALKRDARDASDSEVVVLPRMEVRANTYRGLDAQLSEIEQRQAREEKAAESTALDSILNPAVLRGSSAKARATAAQHRTEVLDWERILRISLQEAKTPEDRARIKADIALLKGLAP